MKVFSKFHKFLIFDLENVGSRGVFAPIPQVIRRRFRVENTTFSKFSKFSKFHKFSKFSKFHKFGYTGPKSNSKSSSSDTTTSGLPHPVMAT